MKALTKLWWICNWPLVIGIALFLLVFLGMETMIYITEGWTDFINDFSNIWIPLLLAIVCGALISFVGMAINDDYCRQAYWDYHHNRED